MIERLKPIPLVFWKYAAGGEPVRDWLNELPREDQRIIGRDIAKVQFGWPIGLPVCRPLRNGLWEVRSPLPSQKTARLILCFHQKTLIVLHGFIKKTRKTPTEDLELAKRRLKEVTK